ncbi:MAG: alpha/beta hydrolase [Acidobacteriaceae bacterium]
MYKSVAGSNLHLYVLEPKEGSAKARPAIIFFHGGGWVAGHAGQFNVQARQAVAGGMAAIEVQYRLLGKGSDESPKICVEDAKSAVRWVREHAAELGVDPNRIVESGGSAGGYLAVFASMAPGWNDPHDDLSVSTKANLLMLYNPVIDNSPWGLDISGLGRLISGIRRFSMRIR